MNPQANNPLHGITLERMLTELVARFGWDSLAAVIDIRCFQNEPSIKSSLKFLRRTPWAREQVEALYRREMTWVPPGPGSTQPAPVVGAKEMRRPCVSLTGARPGRRSNRAAPARGAKATGPPRP